MIGNYQWCLLLSILPFYTLLYSGSLNPIINLHYAILITLSLVLIIIKSTAKTITHLFIFLLPTNY